LLKGFQNDEKKKQNLLFHTHFVNVVDSLKGDIVKSGAIITSDFLKMPAIEYSAVYLESILLNLLSNAV
jgi:hypothetical protein